MLKRVTDGLMKVQEALLNPPEVTYECWMCGNPECKCDEVFHIEVEDCGERDQHLVCRRCDERGVLDKLPTPYRILSDYWWMS